MKRIAALALFLPLLFITAPAQAAAPTCDVQPIVAGECVTQPVADYVLLQLQIIDSLVADREAAYAALRVEQAAHQETRLLLAEAQAHSTYLQDELTKAQHRIRHKQATIDRLRDLIDSLRD